MLPLPGIPSGHNLPVFPGTIVQRMSLRTSVATLVWPTPGIPSGHNPFSKPSLGGRWHGAAVTDEGKGSPC